MGDRIAIVLICMILGALVVGWTTGKTGSERLYSCRDACYQAKSRAYQSCRQIPPVDREARESCFRKADAALKRCLNRC